MQSVLVVSKTQGVYPAFRKILEPQCRLEKARSIYDALENLSKDPKDFIFVDAELLPPFHRRDEYSEEMELLLRLSDSARVVVMKARRKTSERISVIKVGAGYYLTGPLPPAGGPGAVGGLSRQRRERPGPRFQGHGLPKNVSVLTQTRNPQMKAVFEKIRLVATTRATVLLAGHTGTGKGVMAELIHRLSRRSDQPFVSLHCGAVADTLLESELFGHEKGAFTGAIRRKRGRFEMAHGGTIFLDEIGTLTPAAQIKLLQVLQDGTFQTVGSDHTQRVDVRVVSATNVDLSKMCEDGRFRKDLYYRLNVFPITLPGLHQRLEDIPLLADFFLKRLDHIGQKGIRVIHKEVLDAFKRYDWPGNIRELENVLEQAYIMGNPPALSGRNFPDELVNSAPVPAPMTVHTYVSLSDFRKTAIDAAERGYLCKLLTRHQGVIKEASHGADITPRQLNKLMRKHCLRKETFKSSPDVDNQET